MRQTLLQGLRPPLTETAPADDDPELLALAEDSHQSGLVFARVQIVR